MFTRQVNTLLLLCAAFAGGTVSATATTESEGPALADGHLAAVDRAALDGVPEPVLEAALGKIAQLGRQVASMQAEMKEDRVRTDKRAETLSGRVDELERLLAAGSGEPQRGAERQKNQTYVGQEQVEELQLDRRTRRRAQAAPACDLATQTAGLDACCSEMSGGGGHRRAQASCDLPVTCPSLECASIFLPFMADCDAMLSQMPGVQVAQFRSFAASCQQLQASVLQPVSVQMFRVRVNTEGAAQSGAMFPSTDSNGLPLLDLDLDPLHLDPLQPLPPPPPPLAEGGTGAIEQQQTECTSANLATCVPACNTDNHGYELLATIDGSDTKLAYGGYVGADSSAFVSAVLSGAAGAYALSLLRPAGVRVDLTIQPGMSVTITADAMYQDNTCECTQCSYRYPEPEPRGNNGVCEDSRIPGYTSRTGTRAGDAGCWGTDDTDCGVYSRLLWGLDHNTCTDARGSGGLPNEANNGRCEDGSPGSYNSVCDLGTDDADCGIYTVESGGGFVVAGRASLALSSVDLSGSSQLTLTHGGSLRLSSMAVPVAWLLAAMVTMSDPRAMSDERWLGAAGSSLRLVDVTVPEFISGYEGTDDASFHDTSSYRGGRRCGWFASRVPTCFDARYADADGVLPGTACPVSCRTGTPQVTLTPTAIPNVAPQWPPLTGKLFVEADGSLALEGSLTVGAPTFAVTSGRSCTDVGPLRDDGRPTGACITYDDTPPCIVTEAGRCVGRPQGYGPSERCTIEVVGSGGGVLAACDVFDMYDHITLPDGSQRSECPVGVTLVVGDIVEWSSDTGVQGTIRADGIPSWCTAKGNCGLPRSEAGIGGGWQLCFP